MPQKYEHKKEQELFFPVAYGLIDKEDEQHLVCHSYLAKKNNLGGNLTRPLFFPLLKNPQNNVTTI